MSDLVGNSYAFSGTKAHMCFCNAGPSCSKLMMSLVNVSLKFQTFILQIHCYFLLKKSHFFNKK